MSSTHEQHAEELKKTIHEIFMNGDRHGKMREDFRNTIIKGFPNLPKDTANELSVLLLSSWLSGVWEILSYIYDEKLIDSIMVDVMAYALSESSLTEFTKNQLQLKTHVDNIRKERKFRFPLTRPNSSELN